MKHVQDCVYLLCEGQEICEISGFCNGIHDVFALLSCYAAKVDRCIATFQTIWPHLQESNTPKIMPRTGGSTVTEGMV
jgi:hypothetical protein